MLADEDERKICTEASEIDLKAARHVARDAFISLGISDTDLNCRCFLRVHIICFLHINAAPWNATYLKPAISLLHGCLDRRGL
jgi:hypothetical protein